MTITIPQDWYHFVHNETSCISTTFWARRPRLPKNPSLQPPVLLPSRQLETLGVQHGEACLFLSLPRRLIDHVVMFCLDAAVPLNGVIHAPMCGVCRALRNAVHSDDAWQHAFCCHWGAEAVASAMPLGQCWQERYTHVRSTFVKEFSRKPKYAIAYCGKLSLIDPQSPKAIACFLLQHGHLLDKQALGDYVCDSRYSDVLRELTQQISVCFRGISLEASLRVVLLFLRLPGEAPKIDRIMDFVAKAYCEQNPGVFFNADVPFVLLFGMLMLSTDASSKRVKSHMTLEQFIRNSRGINNGGDLPCEYLSEVFRSIQESPFISV